VTSTGTRLSAAERRSALVDAALRVFSEGSYAGATTADIARAAGVSEPILYRHFASKRDLYFACLDEAWVRIRDRIEAQLEASVPEDGTLSIAPATLRETSFLLPSLWMQAITEAGRDEKIRRHVRAHMREAHDFFAEFVRTRQALGAIHHDREPAAEAWIFVGVILLVAVADRLGGLLAADDYAAIIAQRHRWLSGTG